MEYTKVKIKKPYESPNLKIHKLRFEGALLNPSGFGPHVPWDDAPKQQRVFVDESFSDESFQEEDIKYTTYGQF